MGSTRLLAYAQLHTWLHLADQVAPYQYTSEGRISTAPP